jgi:D-alanyl-D-alanine carboxypeptidase/D-alanyl-D-alanine-endopeptidase (penicillin-binding protein 4)
MSVRHLLAGVAWLLNCAAFAQIPPLVSAELTRAKVPAEAVALLVAEVGHGQTPRLSHQSASPMQPASVIKLVTTFAALDTLGPAYTWNTPVYLDNKGKSKASDTVFHGDIYIQGQGDPKLVVERLWLLMRRIQGLGIHQIDGDIVIDRSAFALVPADPGRFDGEPLRPYNAAPDAFLVNYSTLVFTFTPDAAAGVARIQTDPPLAGVKLPQQVPLTAGACNDYRSALAADFADPLRPRFAGSYPSACGERSWPVAYADPGQFAARAVHGMWASMGGKLTGSVRYGSTPAQLVERGPAFTLKSPTLGEVIRDINKYSNNVMAQQLYLTLGRGNTAPDAQSRASFAASNALMQSWWAQRFGASDAPLLENGSGLSRQESISANALGQLLQAAYAAPTMPELMASLPIAGHDGTLRRSNTSASAHLKTGSLHNVLAIGGYVLARSGKRYVVVAMVNHANAAAARPAIEALLEWTAND